MVSGSFHTLCPADQGLALTLALILKTKRNTEDRGVVGDGSLAERWEANGDPRRQRVGTPSKQMQQPDPEGVRAAHVPAGRMRKHSRCPPEQRLAM